MPAQLSYPGVYIEEVPSGVRTIAGVSTSVTAFVGAAARGPVDRPVTLHSFADFERTFGGLWRGSTLGYALQDFFVNGGGEAIVVRVVNGAAAATISSDGGDLEFVAADPGAWGNALRVEVVQVADEPDAEPDRFNLIVYEGAAPVERYLNLSTDPASPRYVVRVLETQSPRLRVAVDGGNPVLPDGQPDEAIGVDALTATADSGDDGDAIGTAQLAGSEAQKTGMYALEDADIFNLLCIPPPALGDGPPSAIYDDALSYCVRRRAMLIVDPHPDWTKDTVVAGVDGMALSGTDARNAAFYFPSIVKADPLMDNQPTLFPPSGAIAGVIARTDAQRGVWKAPAGIDAAIAGVPALSVLLTDGENGDLNPLGINVLRSFPAFGRIVWGARTMRGSDQAADEYKYVPVRRTALFIEESLYRGTQWVVFEPNDEPLWSQIRLNVGAFMQGLFRQGAFQGTTPAEAYFVKCDRTTTTQTDINLGIVNILVGFAPLKPAEFVVVKIQQIAGQVEA
ncbi:MAG TPA: phage tail sheath C-terminal domain-containing protein [Actinomycetota bacterium]|nr:phage tail sheath C-terminal domain-containing protein [Actinomycetota bacterium]